MYVFSFITGFFLTCSNTTPTITIFVPLLFEKAVYMVKHIMRIVQGNTEFIKAGQTPVLGVFHGIFGDHFSVHYWLNWVHEDD